MSGVSSFNPFGPNPGGAGSDSGNQPGPAGQQRPQFGMPGSQPVPGPSAPGPTRTQPITPGQPFTVVGPPSGLLFAALALAAIGLVVGIVGLIGANAIALIGWALAGPVSIVVLGLFVASDTARQAEPVYARPGWVRAVYGVVAALIVVGIVVASIGIALWIGHR